MKTKQATPALEGFRDDFIAILNKHTGHLDSSEMLAVASYTVGQMVAMMDQRKFTPDAVMELVAKNIEAGNAQAIADASKWMGRA